MWPPRNPMAIESDTDRLALLADFGVTATYGSTSFTVLFERPYAEVRGVATTIPAAVARSSDVVAAGVAWGGSIVVYGTNYTVRGIEPDGTGFSQFTLEEA